MNFRGFAVSAIILVTAAGATLADKPAIFGDRTLQSAKDDAARKPGSIILLDFTAEWCGPCKVMDKTTWKDEKVVKWLESNNVVSVQVDVDKSPDIAKEFKVAAMPTIILLKDGNTLARVVGGRNPQQMLTWLESSTGAAPAAAPASAPAAPADLEPGSPEAEAYVDKRYESARDNMLAQEFDKAAADLEWLFVNMVRLKPSMIGVHGSFLTGDIQRVIEQHPPARVRFAKLRDTHEATLRTDDRTWENLDHWLKLNALLGEDAKTLAWYDRIKDADGSAETIEKSSLELERAFLRTERWADAGRVMRFPMQQVELKLSLLGDDRVSAPIPAEMKQRMAASARNQTVQDISVTYACLLAAGRDDDAREVAAAAITSLDDAAIREELVRCAAVAGHARPEHLTWLDDAQKAKDARKEDPELRARVKELLKK